MLCAELFDRLIHSEGTTDVLGAKLVDEAEDLEFYEHRLGEAEVLNVDPWCGAEYTECKELRFYEDGALDAELIVRADATEETYDTWYWTS